MILDQSLIRPIQPDTFQLNPSQRPPNR